MEKVEKNATSKTDLRMGNTPDWQVAIRRRHAGAVTTQAV
jgi:hypothetical protein